MKDILCTVYTKAKKIKFANGLFLDVTNAIAYDMSIVVS
jgi:hypothetical protein